MDHRRVLSSWTTVAEIHSTRVYVLIRLIAHLVFNKVWSRFELHVPASAEQNPQGHNRQDDVPQIFIISIATEYNEEVLEQTWYCKN